MARSILVCLCTVLHLLSCSRGRQDSPDAGATLPAPDAALPPVAASPAAPPPPTPAPDWRDAYDFDGDGQRDSVIYTFTGGAHCCYLMGVALSSTRATVKLPFEMDGGYVGGLDLSRPHQFFIRTPDGGLPELIMEIETYNGRPEPLNPAWKRRYGFKTHRVAVCFPGGKVRVRDYVPDLAPCTKDMQGSAR